MTVYGYARVSTQNQELKRQIRNILNVYPEAKIYSEKFTGTTLERPEFEKLLRKVKQGDTIVFDEVSRMSRNAEEGMRQYKALFDAGVDLVFLKNPSCNTSKYREALKKKIDLSGSEDSALLKTVEKFVNDIFMILAEDEIKRAFEKSQSERDFLSARTKEGQAVARANGKRIGKPLDAYKRSDKVNRAKEIIRATSRSFNGNLSDNEAIRASGVSRPTYYKLKKELQEELKEDD